jgi:hypothetical protein
VEGAVVAALEGSSWPWGCLFRQEGLSSELRRLQGEVRGCLFSAAWGGTGASAPSLAASWTTSPLLALDLPLKVLVWRNREGGVLVSYNAISYLARRHDIPEDLVGNIAGIDALVEVTLGEA